MYVLAWMSTHALCVCACGCLQAKPEALPHKICMLLGVAMKKLVHYVRSVKCVRVHVY